MSALKTVPVVLALLATLALAACGSTGFLNNPVVGSIVQSAGPTLVELAVGATDAEKITSVCGIVNMSETYFDDITPVPQNVAPGNAVENSIDAICNSPSGSAASVAARLQPLWTKMQALTVSVAKKL